MRIGITQRVELIASYGERRDCLDQAWSRLLEELGHIVIPIPNALQKVELWAQQVNLEGLILSGGNDLAGLSNASNAAPERDRTESALLAHAQLQGWPVLGVCRGLQMMNVWLGGELSPVREHAGVRHPVMPTTDALPYFQVFHEANSFHDWGIEQGDLADGLRAQVLSSDGCVEAFEHESLPWTGIMWHPEREAPFSDKDKQLIKRRFQR